MMAFGWLEPYFCCMLTQKEEDFLVYWEKNREIRKQFLYQLFAGLPLGMGLAGGIGLIYYTGFYWYKQLESVHNREGTPWALMLALVLIAVFMAIMGKRFQWEQLEQRYLELKAKKKAGGEE